MGGLQVSVFCLWHRGMELSGAEESGGGNDGRVRFGRSAFD